MKTLRSTTALALCVALSVPHPVVAAEHAGLKACGDAPEPPCLLDDGVKLTRGNGNGLEACPDPLSSEATPCVTAEGFVAVAGDEDASDEETAEDATDEAPAEEAAEAPADEPPADQADAAQADEQPAQDSAAETTAEEAPADTAAEAPADTADEGPAEETEAESADETEAEETAAETEEEAPSEQATAEAEAASSTAEATAEAEEVPAEDATAEVEEAPAEEATAEAEEEAPAEDATAEAEETAPAEEVTADSAEPEVIEEEAPAAAAAAAVDDSDAPAEDAEVATEEVTEDTARSSSEDFETAATGDVTASAAVQGDDRSGLSNFEKALLLGLGAVAVGSILNNGDEVVSNSGDRVVLRDESGDLRVLKDDDALLRQPGSQVRTETFNDGSTRTIVTREDGTKIITIRAADGRVLRRSREFADGRRVVLFDDTETAEPVVVSELPQVTRRAIDVDVTDEDALRRALAEVQAADLNRRFSLRQVRQIREVRELAPEIELDAVTFATGSAAIEPSQAEELAALGRAMRRIIDERPGEVFLIEGHTDAVGSATYNLALSDRRAETVALALTEYFGVPPENMITQGYGESALKIDTQEAERLNRRAAVRRITPLLRQAVLDN